MDKLFKLVYDYNVNTTPKMDLLIPERERYEKYLRLGLEEAWRVYFGERACRLRDYGREQSSLKVE